MRTASSEATRDVCLLHVLSMAYAHLRGFRVPGPLFAAIFPFPYCSSFFRWVVFDISVKPLRVRKVLSLAPAWCFACASVAFSSTNTCCGRALSIIQDYIRIFRAQKLIFLVASSPNRSFQQTRARQVTISPANKLGLRLDVGKSR
jgi:hypothetical protein